MQAIRANNSFSVLEPEVMEIEGRLDAGSAFDVEEDARLCIQSGARNMVFDCRRLGYISGAGLRAILTVAREMKLAGGKFVVCGLQPQVREMFDASGLNDLIPSYGNPGEAAEALAA
jgi:anti-anti-sigma factor